MRAILPAFWIGVGVVAAALSLPGTFQLLLLTVGGLLPRRKRSAQVCGKSWRVAAIIPAHDEELGIQATVESLRSADHEGFEMDVVVVADNCSDRTAEMAAQAGAIVLERNNSELRGKGHALDYAFRTLLPEDRPKPVFYDAFLVVDADTEVAADFLMETVGLLQSGADAVQCRYLVRNAGASVRTRLMSIALRAFNVLRARGRDGLGLSCGIYGNGFGLRGETLAAVPYVASSVVEDLEYHLLLVRSGHSVRFADSTTVYGEMPARGKGVATQRIRWEGGRLKMAREKAPELFGDVLHGRVTSIEPLLDLLLLPLAFHVTLLAVAASAPFPAARLAGVCGLLVVAVHLMAAIAAGGGNWREAFSLIMAPFYVLWKLLLIPALIKNSAGKTVWVRTERAAQERPQ